MLIVLSQVFVAASIVAYFAYYWVQGSTLGMRAVGSELVRETTGRPPGWRRTVLRGIVSWLIALAVLNVYFASSGRSEDNPFNAYERALIAASIAVAAVGIAAKAWMLVDGRRRRPSTGSSGSSTSTRSCSGTRAARPGPRARARRSAPAAPPPRPA